MSIVIRRAEPRDLSTLGQLGADLMRTHYAFDTRRFLPPGENPEVGYAWFLGTQLEAPDTVIFVGEHEASVVGYVYAGLEPLSWKELRGPAGFIHDIVVSEGARRTGIAHRLLLAAVTWLRQQGVPRVMLWTATGNAPAQALFAATGFRQTMIEMTLELDADDDAGDDAADAMPLSRS